MSDEVFTEYRAIWPNGDEVWPDHHFKDHDEFKLEYDHLIEQLRKLSVPGEGHPWVEFRTVTVTRVTTEWDTVNPGNKPKHADTMPLTTSGPEYANQAPITSEWPTLEWQIEQVANHRFRFTDPCIVCGGQFTSCGHTFDDTRALISRIKREHHV